MVQSAERSLEQIRDLLRSLGITETATGDLLASGMTGVIASSPELEVSRTGLYAGKAAAVVYIVGRRDQGWSDTSTLGDCVEYLDGTQPRINAVSAATEYFIRSTSASDTNAAGTGARQMRIVYLDAAGAQQVMEVALAGTTPVSIGSGISYVQWMEVSAVGSNTVAVGKVTVSSKSTAGNPAVSEIVESISAGGNRSLSGRYMVPTGRTAYLIIWDGSSIGNANIDTRLRATVFADDRTISPGAHHFQDLFYLTAGQHHDMPLFYVACPAGAEIKVSAIPSNATPGNRLDASFRMLVVAE